MVGIPYKWRFLSEDPLICNLCFLLIIDDDPGGGPEASCATRT